MRSKKKFFSLNKKIMCLGILLSSIFLVFCAFFWGGSRYVRKQEDELTQIQRQFFAMVNSFEQIDSYLYKYAQSQNENLKEICEEALDDLEISSGELMNWMKNPFFTDLNCMTEVYVEESRKLLGEQEGKVSQFLSLYAECSENLKPIRSFMEQYTEVINTELDTRKSRIEQEQRMIFAMLAADTVLFAGICLIVLIRFSRRITENLMVLTHRAEWICEGKWDVEMNQPAETGDEVEILSKAFYRMLGEIKNQMEELKQQEAVKRQLKEAELAAVSMKARLERAQLRMLQSRVNPHFLFNALNVIAGQAAEENADKTVDMILETADYLHYSLSRLEKTVTLEEELENASHYLNIQKRRFGERICFSVSCEEACKRVKIPALILQPLCENALCHGIAPLTQGGSVSVSAFMSEDRVRITVEDDGIGFTPERLAQIRERLVTEDYDDTQGIGLYNIMQRLLAYFQQGVSCEIESAPGIKTSVSIAFPARYTNEAGMMEEKNRDESDTGR